MTNKICICNNVLEIRKCLIFKRNFSHLTLQYNRHRNYVTSTARKLRARPRLSLTISKSVFSSTVKDLLDITMYCVTNLSYYMHVYKIEILRYELNNLAINRLWILWGNDSSINFKHISLDIPNPDDLVSNVSFFLVQVAATFLRGRENISVHETGQILQKEEEWRYIFLRILY